ncbi:hypothetical protein DFH08DRAFT_745946, partial [Mycena albidolilacea]
MPAPGQQDTPPPLVLPQSQSQFVPPIAPLNSPAGASPSFRSLFPHVKSACITSVITHDLPALDLYKLDKRVKDPTPQLIIDASGTVAMGSTKLRTYKTLNSVTFPLHVYFAILGAHLRTVAPSVYFWCYITHIESLALEYEWSAVFEYHTLFFDLRQEDMLSELYSNWGLPDPNLLCVHVYPFKKAVQVAKPPSTKRPATSAGGEACHNFNAGKCDTPCAYKHPHICSAPGCG